MAKFSTIEVPQGLLAVALKTLSTSFTQHQIVQYCSIVFEAYAFPYRRQHRLLPQCSYFHYRELEALFGRGHFAKLNNTLGWLQNIDLPNGHSHQWQVGVTSGATKAYALTDFGYHAIRDAMTDTKYPLSHRKLPPKDFALRSRDASGSNSRGRFSMSSNIAIKTSLIKEAMRDISLLKSDRTARGTPVLSYLANFYDDLSWEDCETQLKNNRDLIADILRISQNPDLGCRGQLHQYYAQAISGRWYSRGPFISLQNMPRQLRTIILQGHYDYDMESCHYALFAQMASRHAFDTPVIDQLVANKLAFRLKIALSLGVSVAAVKKVLISLIYGSPLSSSLYCSLADSLGKPTAEAFCQLKDIQSLHSEIKLGSKIIIEGYKENSRRRGSITNDIGRSCVISRCSRASMLSHLLQGAEAQILTVIGKRWGHLMTLLMHDGFVTKKRLKTEMLSAHVFKETGWNVEFSEELISISKCTEK